MKKETIIKIMAIILIVIAIICGSFYCIKEADFKVKNKDNTIEIGLNEKVDISKKVDACYSFFFHCFKPKITIDKDINTKKLGEYKVVVNLKYKDKQQNKKMIVKVIDKTAPELTLKEEQYYVCPNGKVPKYNVEAIDNIDGDVSSSIKASYEEKQLFFEAKDKHGNKKRKRAKSIIADKEQPKIELKDGNVYYMKLNEEYQEPGYLAIDNCDDDLTSKVEVRGEVDNTKSGTYTIKYKVKDSSNNEFEIDRLVYVLDGDMNRGSYKIIYLTFDDGPSAYTGKLLDILQKYNVKATFFVTGMQQQYNSNIKRAYDEGHSLGLHTYTHNYNIYASVDAFFNDLNSIQTYIEQLTGHKTYLMRFAGGSSNTVSRFYSIGIMSILTTEVENRGFRYWDWNVSTGDGGTVSTEQVFINAINGIQEKNHSFVLMHDTKEDTVNAVESIIQYGLANGYDFLPLTMNAPSCQHGVNN